MLRRHDAHDARKEGRKERNERILVNVIISGVYALRSCTISSPAAASAVACYCWWQRR